jgi:restriction system protein
MSNERIGELLRHLFAVLQQHPKGLLASEALARLAAAAKLTPHETRPYESSGVPRFAARLGYATSSCVAAGWLNKHRGRWTVTPAGLAASREFRDPELFCRRARQLHNAHRARERKSAAGAPPASPSATAPMTTTELPAGDGRAIDTARGTAWAEIERHVAALDAYGFQRLVADLLRAMGWSVPWEAPPGPDGGVDISALRDPLGAVGGRLKVQVKSGTTKVRADALRAFAATVNEEEAGLLVAAGGFTDEADAFARLQARKRLMLIDLPRLVELWARHYPRLDVEARQRLPIAPVWFLTAI